MKHHAISRKRSDRDETLNRIVRLPARRNLAIGWNGYISERIAEPGYADPTTPYPDGLEPSGNTMIGNWHIVDPDSGQSWCGRGRTRNPWRAEPGREVPPSIMPFLCNECLNNLRGRLPLRVPGEETQ